MQESGLIHIVPLICTLTVLFFSVLNPLRVNHWGGVAAEADRLLADSLFCLNPEFPSGSTIGWLQSVMDAPFLFSHLAGDMTFFVRREKMHTSEENTLKHFKEIKMYHQYFVLFLYILQSWLSKVYFSYVKDDIINLSLSDRKRLLRKALSS